MINSPMVATALLLGLLAGGVASFSIVGVSEHAAPYTAGDTVQLVCRADGWWEYCSWIHGDTQCNLQWRYSTGNVTMQGCQSKLAARISIAGDYNNHECSIRIKNVDIRDEGTWKCKMESYVSGIGRGYTKTRSLVIAIAKKTTTSTTETITSTAAPTTTYTPVADNITYKEMEEFLNQEDTFIFDDFIYFKSQDDIEDESKVEAQPVSDLEAAGLDRAIFMIGFGMIMAVVFIMTVLGVKLYSRRKSRQANTPGYLFPSNPTQKIKF